MISMFNLMFKRILANPVSFNVAQGILTVGVGSLKFVLQGLLE